jgi:hypothetical protein
MSEKFLCKDCGNQYPSEDVICVGSSMIKLPEPNMYMHGKNYYVCKECWMKSTVKSLFPKSKIRIVV